jgi:malate dehydrogenase (oxaloacetate-decarboxylating)(NADP+)
MAKSRSNFGPEYLIPNPFDPRLIGKIAPAVAEAAMASGVASRPIKDLEAYRESLDEFVYHFGLIMKPVFSQAKQAPRRIVFAEGEDDRVLRAVQVIVDEGNRETDSDRRLGRHRSASSRR